MGKIKMVKCFITDEYIKVEDAVDIGNGNYALNKYVSGFKPSETIEIELTPEIMEKLVQLSIEWNISINLVVTKILYHYINSREIKEQNATNKKGKAKTRKKR